MTTLVVLWMVLGAATMAVALYRKILTLHEVDTIVMEDWKKQEVAEQVTRARKLDAIDRWGKTLTVVSVAAGLAIGAFYLYAGWTTSGRY